MAVTPDHVATSNVIIVRRSHVPAAAYINGAANLVAIARAGIGYDKIDLAAATAHDVVVFNSPAGMTHSTASGALLFILAFSKRFHLQQQIVREGRWDRQMEAVGDDLAGFTLGIVGFGRSGKELARLIAPFQMRMIAFSRSPEKAAAQEFGVHLVDSLETLLAQSDYVSLHGRLDETTRGMIGARELAMMKPSAYLINLARGEMIDEAALYQALLRRQIAGAGLDVFEREPLPADSPLLTLPNVLLTPHWLASTWQSGRATAESLMHDISEVAAGRLPHNILNPEVTRRPGFLAKLQKYSG